MKSKKVYFLIFTIAILILLLIIYKKFLGGFGSNYFIQYTSFVAMPAKSKYNIDLGYFIKRGERDILNKKNIASVSFVNSKLTQINDINFIEGSTTKKYNIRTLSLDVSFLSSGTENVDHIRVAFYDGSEKIYSVGNWRFVVSDLTEGSHLETSSYFPAACGNFSSYFMKFKNISDKSMTVNKLILEVPKVTTDFKEFTVNPKGEIDKEYPYTFINERPEAHRIYFIKPRVDYTLDKSTYAYYPPGTFYGTLNLNDEMVEQEVSRGMACK